MDDAETRAAALPHFARPPLVETATSVQFSPLRKLTNAMMGLLWHEHFRAEFPETEDADAIEPQAETFDDGPPQRSQLMFRFGTRRSQRTKMLSAAGHWMVQVQQDRLVFNWRKLRGHDYPRWRKTLPRFEQAFERFRRFVEAHELGDVVLEQWEVTYANHLVRGEDWESPADWAALLPGVICPARVDSELRMEGASAAMHLEIMPQRGRLHVECRHGTRKVGARTDEILALQLTARGPVVGANYDSVVEGLHLGRRMIIDTFARITGEAAQHAWGRTDAE